MIFRLFVLLTLILSGTISLSAEGTGRILAKEGAWCWFADPRALHYENHDGSINATYVGYIDVHGNIKATQIDYRKGTSEEVLVRSWFQPDDHDNPSFLVLPDERVMIFYSRHTDEKCFYYRISQRKGDITSLGEEKRLETDHNTTYPNPFILSDDPDHIYMCWRGIGWHPTVARMTMPDSNDNVSFDWGPYQMVQSSGARPYAKYMSNGKDKIYLAYTTGHPDNESPNWVYFNSFDIKTHKLADIKGREVSTVGEGAPFAVRKTEEFFLANPYMVVDHPSKRRDWLWNMALKADGTPVIAMTRISEDKKKHDYYYVRWTGELWQKTFIANGGGHFHQSPSTENCYSGGMAIDRDEPNVVYCSVPMKGVYEIVKYTMTEQGDELFSMLPVTYGSKKNNVRPYVIEGTLKSKSSYMSTESSDKASKNGPLRLTWMNGDYYYWLVNTRYPEGYPTSIMSDVQLPKRKAQGKGTKVYETTLKMDADNYGGEVFTWGNVSYYINKETYYPTLLVNGKEYRSSNIFATADSWATDNRHTTDGKWYQPRKIGSCTITVTHDGTYLTILRDGMIDQRVKCSTPKGKLVFGH